VIPFRVVFGDQEKFRVTVLSGYACCGRGSCRQAFRGHRGQGSIAGATAQWGADRGLRPVTIRSELGAKVDLHY